ncbi:STAS domain-containing protein [Saccharothrix longispora]|uniref:Anti-sigma factor antagonist n=1 Tax=Saccharothrix longispora TaxID=33920 RepID=A0ABU1PQB1_9PSEU|nr:STAS domain-containing protein [Saccharothrix longispora]MDR6592830.1 anti-anti-sigma factor [Saccharothrix longispora]
MFDVILSSDGGTHTLALVGELDHQSAPRVHEALDRLHPAPGDRVVLSLEGLAFCDSSGLSAFIAAYERVTAAGAALTLAAPPATLTRMLRTTGLDDVLPWRDDDRGRRAR